MPSSNQPYSQTQNAYEPLFENFIIPDEEYDNLDLSMPDDDLVKMLIDDLDANISHWEQKPWNLKKTDKDNTNYLLGDQTDEHEIKKTNSGGFTDNRLFSSARAILSYATGQLAVPEITPSRSDEVYLKGARAIQQALYQHAKDNKVDIKTRTSVLNLITRKRGPMKLRFDPNKGTYGDVVTEVVPPEDIIIDRYAGFMDNPRVIYQRIRCSIDELVAKFPEKKAQIYAAFSIQQGRYSQRSRFVAYYEAWFTYIDADNLPREGLCWFLPEPALILDKMKNPNWVYVGSDKKQKEENVLECPPKPYVWFNYMNTGHSYIDDTCLFEQAKPLQEMLNYRNQQLNTNIDFMNGRWVASKKAFGEQDAQKFVNKGARTVALVDADDVGKALQVQTPNQLPAEVYQSVIDFRNEIDEMMGTPSVFKGATPDKQGTLGRDMMQKQQAGALQDDLVRCVASGMEDYYKILLQMMRVYYTDDYWFQVKGGDGKFEFIMLNGDSIDSNVKVGVQVDSTLPLDKMQIRATAMQLWQAGHAIDYRTFMEDLGLPNPDIRTERYLRSQIDLYTYMQSVEQGMSNNDAEVDIMLLIANKTPDERDNYNEDYLNYFNHFLTLNRFTRLDQEAKQRIVTFLMAIQHVATQTLNAQTTMLNDAGIVDRPPIFPLPKRTENIRLVGNMSPEQTQQIAGSEGQMFTPVTGAEQAQNPANQQAPQQQQGAAPAQM